MPPTSGNGKICYLEIPALYVRRSAAFYQAVVGWQSDGIPLFGVTRRDILLKHVATRQYASGLVQSEYEVAG